MNTFQNEPPKTEQPRPAVLDRLQRPLEYLRISVTDRCNFRCPYCMPAQVFGSAYRFLPRQELLTFEEITRLVSALTRLGVRRVRLTGGEPLVRSELERLVAMLAALQGVEEIMLTTNASLLAEKAALLRQAGLQRLNISLDSLDDAVFQKMNGERASLERVLDGIAAAEAAGFSPLKINTVVMRGINDHTIVDVARHFRERGHIVRFIEYMDVGTLNGWQPEHVMSFAEMVAAIDRELPIEPLPPNYAGEVVRRFRYKDGSGELGFITSVSQPFCGGCTRLRLSAEGKLFTCLFSAQGHDVRRVLRSGEGDEALTRFLTDLWQGRADRYSDERMENQSALLPKVEMYQIGG